VLNSRDESSEHHDNLHVSYTYRTSGTEVTWTVGATALLSHTPSLAAPDDPCPLFKTHNDITTRLHDILLKANSIIC